MGGIILCEDGVPVQVLDYPRLKSHIQNKTIDIPRITSAEVQDRSKGDFISKGVVLVHTTWFVVECIARWRENLPLSELEVVTLGFALLNAITYGLWWNKPQNVMTAIRIESKSVSEAGADAQRLRLLIRLTRHLRSSQTRRPSSYPRSKRPQNTPSKYSSSQSPKRR